MKNNKGITLIALIITIIVMIILVAVTINLATEGGLFSRAKDASSKYQIAEEKEKINVALAVWKATKITGEGLTGDGHDFFNCINNELKDDANNTEIDEHTVKATFKDTNNVYIVTDDGNIELDKSFTITFEMGEGGTLASEQVKTAHKGDTVALLTPTKEKAYFMGWYLDKDYTGDSIIKLENIQGNTTVYAKWLQETDISYFTWTDDTANGTTAVKGLTNAGKQLTEIAIPSKKGNLTVTSVLYHAFYQDNNLTTLCIPDSVTGFGGGAFQGCGSLKKVIIGKGITTIGANAFNYCGAIEDITMPICASSSSNSFNCSNLKKVTLTAGLSSGVGANYGAGSSTSSGTREYTPWYKARGHEVEVVIEDGVTSIGNHTFYNSSYIKIINFPSTITSVGSYAFCNCASLTNEMVSQLLRNNASFGDSAFMNCTGITGSLNLDNTSIASKTFQGCTRLEEISANRSVGSYAFSGCSSLKKVTLGNNITALSNNEFASCSAIEEFTMPISMTIGSNVFATCANLKKVHFLVGNGAGVNYTAPSGSYRGSREYTPWYNSSAEKLEVTFDEGITRIGNYTFYGRTNLAINNIPSTLTTIGEYAFNGCTGLTNEMVCMALNENISYGTGAFMNCSGITGSLNLDNIAISQKMFQGCSRLEEISVNRSIGGYAFNGCSSLKKVVLGNNITALSNNEFGGCSQIEEFTMPVSMTIGSNSCARAPIKKVTLLPGTGTGVNYTAASGSYRGTREYTPWYTNSNEMVVEVKEGVTYIGNYIFYNCSGLNKVIYNGGEYTSKSGFTNAFAGTVSGSAFNGTGLSN